MASSVGHSTIHPGSPSLGTAPEQETEMLQEETHEETLQLSFEPVFALITNTTTNATVHPRVHYVFSDDDTSALIAAASNDDPSNRSLIVDLAPNDSSNGWQVEWSSSFSPDFAITATELSRQQQGNGDNDNDAANGTLMLRVEGMTREPVDSRFDPDNSLPSSSSGSGALGKEEVDGLAEEFRRRMGTMKKVVIAGEQRQNVAHQQQQGLIEGDEKRVDDVPASQPTAGGT